MIPELLFGCNNTAVQSPLESELRCGNSVLVVCPFRFHEPSCSFAEPSQHLFCDFFVESVLLETQGAREERGGAREEGGRGREERGGGREERGGGREERGRGEGEDFFGVVSFMNLALLPLFSAPSPLTTINSYLCYLREEHNRVRRHNCRCPHKNSSVFGG